MGPVSSSGAKDTDSHPRLPPVHSLGQAIKKPCKQMNRVSRDSVGESGAGREGEREGAELSG